MLYMLACTHISNHTWVLSLSLPLSLSLLLTHTHAEAAEIVRCICLAVGHLHYMNIAHRDLKVSNCCYELIHSRRGRRQLYLSMPSAL